MQFDTLSAHEKLHETLLNHNGQFKLKHLEYKIVFEE